MKKELLRMENIVKTFPGVRALNNAAITVHEGEVMGLMGENGAGKSTLMKDVYKRQRKRRCPCHGERHEGCRHHGGGY